MRELYCWAYLFPWLMSPGEGTSLERRSCFHTTKGLYLFFEKLEVFDITFSDISHTRNHFFFLCSYHFHCSCWHHRTSQDFKPEPQSQPAPERDGYCPLNHAVFSGSLEIIYVNAWHIVGIH